MMRAPRTLSRNVTTCAVALARHGVVGDVDGVGGMNPPRRTGAHMSEHTVTRYFFGTCGACGATRHAVEEMRHGKRYSYPVPGGRTYTAEQAKCLTLTCSCGGGVRAAKRLTVTKTDHACDRRCTHAKGHICDCSCGGKNHGVM